MAAGATKRLGRGEYLHLATNATVRRLAETLWEVKDAKLQLIGRFKTKTEALDTLDKMPAADVANLPQAGEPRGEYLARVLSEVIPPAPGHVYRVIEIPAEFAQQASR